MASRFVTYSLVFTPSANQINLSGIPNFNVAKLSLIIDVTAGVILYAAGSPGLGFSAISGTLLTLQAPMGACQATDAILVRYDDGDQAGAAAYVQLAVNGAVANSGNPIPVALDNQTLGLAEDSSVQTVITNIGTIGGASPPSLPGGSTGVMGLLRWLGSLLLSGVTSIGAAANGAAVGSYPVLSAGWDGVYTRTLHTDALGLMLTGSGLASVLNISVATVVKAAPGRVAKISVTTAGSAAGTLNDFTTTSGAAAANEIAVIPNTVGVYSFDWPCANGIVITPGSGQVVSVSYA